MLSLVPCSDGAGIIESVGPYSKWKPGENVLLHLITWLSGDVQNVRLDEVLGGGRTKKGGGPAGVDAIPSANTAQ